MKIWDSPYYIQSRACLKPVGIWPFQSFRTRLLLQGASSIAVLSVLIPLLVKTYMVFNDTTSFMLCVPTLLLYAQCLIKFIHLIIHTGEARELLETVGNDFQRFKDENLRVLYNHAGMAHTINRAYVGKHSDCKSTKAIVMILGMSFVVFMFSGITAFNLSAYLPHTLDMLAPLPNGSRPRDPVRLVHYNIPRFDESFSFVLYHGFALDFIILCMLVGFDTFVFICARHCCALFENVTVELRRAINSNYDESDPIVRRNKIYRGISNGIVIHKHALQFGVWNLILFAERLDDFCATVIIIVIATSLACCTFTEFATLVHKQNFIMVMKFTVFTAGQFFDILYYNYPGQLVKDYSLLIHESCRELKWYREDVTNKGRMLLVLIMLKSQTPSCLTAGKLFELDLQNFVKILKASLSYFAVLRSVEST